MGRLHYGITSLILLSIFTLTTLSLYYLKLNSSNNGFSYLLFRVDVSSTSAKFGDTLRNLSRCDEVLKGNETLIRKFPKLPINTRDQNIQERIKHGCWSVIDYYSFNTNWDSLTPEETKNPIAYSILAHRNTEQLIVLLAQIYSPQNVYCVHIDKKSPKSILETFRLVQKCFPNVILASQQVDVWYASFSRLQADLNCMEDLLKSPIAWNYLINICGQDFPIRTNVEIIHRLKEVGDHNVIKGKKQTNSRELLRTKFSHKFENHTLADGSLMKKMVLTNTLKSPPPHNMTVLKNLAYNVYTRPFLRWVFNSTKAKDLLEWSKDTKTPDEHVWSMLESLEEAPTKTGRIKQLFPFISWRPEGHCTGFWNHFSCVFGSGDVNFVLKRNKLLFANKFDFSYDARPIICIRDWLKNRFLNANINIG